MPHGHFVKDWMSETVIAVSPETKAIEALYLLKSHSIRFLPVLLGTKLLGVIAEKDLIHPVKSLKNLDVAKMYRTEGDIWVSHFMIENPVVVTPQDHVSTAANLIVKHKIHGLPVIENRNSPHVVGVITTTDLLKSFLELVEVTNY